MLKVLAQRHPQDGHDPCQLEGCCGVRAIRACILDFPGDPVVKTTGF